MVCNGMYIMVCNGMYVLIIYIYICKHLIWMILGVPHLRKPPFLRLFFYGRGCVQPGHSSLPRKDRRIVPAVHFLRRQSEI